MPDVTVRLYAGAGDAAGCSETTAPAGSVAEIRAALSARFGSRLERVLACSSLLVDGLVVHSPQAIIDAGSVVDVLPPFAGG